MGRFKRFVLIIYSLATILGVGVLASLWFRWTPLLPSLFWLMHQGWFYLVEAILLGIVALGALFILIKAISAPCKNAQLEIEREGGRVTITKKALQSAVEHVMSAHPEVQTHATKIRITGCKKPKVRISVKVDVDLNASLSELGDTLQEEISSTLEAFIGYPITSTHVTFTKASKPTTDTSTSTAPTTPSITPAAASPTKPVVTPTTEPSSTPTARSQSTLNTESEPK